MTYLGTALEPIQLPLTHIYLVFITRIIEVIKILKEETHHFIEERTQINNDSIHFSCGENGITEIGVLVTNSLKIVHFGTIRNLFDKKVVCVEQILMFLQTERNLRFLSNDKNITVMSVFVNQIIDSFTVLNDQSATILDNFQIIFQILFIRKNFSDALNVTTVYIKLFVIFT